MNKNEPQNTLFLLTLLISLAVSLGLSADEWERITDLRGSWKFEIGNNPEWGHADFDDSDWEDIFVPAAWEDEGFPGYDGHAWYRKRFTVTDVADIETFYLRLGRIDDVDEVFLNGRMINYSGSFPPDFQTAYALTREYLVPAEWLNTDGDNVVAVHVYDDFQAGGIVDGQIGVWARVYDINMLMDLSGKWKFQPGDEIDWQQPDIDDSDWDELLVPLQWEAQEGYREYDGFGWYRKRFFLPEDHDGERLILVLGKIDDLDEVYLNGVRIGRTGRIRGEEPRISGDEYNKLRNYYMPRDELNFGAENVLAVRVYDGLIDGGIYEGPIGIVTRDEYRRWERETDRKSWSIFDLLFGN